MSTLRLVGASHLFVVPSIRTSHYVHMLSSAFPSLLTATPGDIQEEGLPDLRHLIVFDDVTATISGRPNENGFSGVKDWRDTRAAIDFREALLWEENGREARVVQDIGNTLNRDEVVNLQFTR